MSNQKKTVGKVILIVLCILLSLVLVGLIAAYIYMDTMLDKINRYPSQQETLSSSQIAQIEQETDPVDPTFDGPTLAPEDVTWSTEPVEIIDDERIINILLIGQDRVEGEWRQRSDAMILCTVNKETKTLTMTSFLRDLYVQIPGYQDNRINAAYQFGGMELLNKTLEKNFGVVVDGNIEVDFTQFEKIVDMMGGVDISLTSAEAGHLNGLHGWSLREGMNHLNGNQALQYSRIRYIGTDFGRTNRQRTVLTALINQSKNLNLAEINNLLSQALGLITTDMSNADILGYMLELFPILKGIEIKTQYIPAEGTFQYAQVRGMSVLVPNIDACRELLLNTIIKNVE